MLLVAVLVGSVQSEFTDIPSLKITKHPEGGTVPIGPYNFILPFTIMRECEIGEYCL